MDLYNNHYGMKEELLRQNCEPVKEFMELTPIEVIHKILEFYTCPEECGDRSPVGLGPLNTCAPFIECHDTIGIRACGLGKTIIMDFLCFDFTAYVNVSGDEVEIIRKALEAFKVREEMNMTSKGAFIIGAFTSLRFFLAHMSMLSTEEKDALKSNFNRMLDSLRVGEENGIQNSDL